MTKSLLYFFSILFLCSMQCSALDAGITISTQIIDGVKFSEDGKTLIDFSDENNQTHYTIPEGVTHIMTGAFTDGLNLRSITIPASVTVIAGDAFRNTNLTEIRVAKGNPNFKSIDGALFSADGKTLICHPNRKIVEYTIPNSVTAIGDYAFRGCTSLTSVTIPDSVTSIGEDAFRGCPNLSSDIIPANVKIIECPRIR